MDARVTGCDWRPRTPPLPEDRARLLRPDDPDWFAREMAIAAAPPWWFWHLTLRRFSWLVGIFGRIEVTGKIPEDLRRGPPDPGRLARTGRTCMARLALGLGVPVIPVSQWGTHEVLQYRNDWGKVRTLFRAIVRRPVLRVHVGPPVVLDDLRVGRVGDANHARYRIAAAITRGLAPLRYGEADRPALVDPTRPTTAVAAFPGGVVPDDVP